ncbi:MAG TPA: SDR family NAD(P)-dependent oxidoreductase [Solirubrobacteraceae bacterium]
MDLRGATCLVTGANRGIGLALSQRLAREPLSRLLLGMRRPEDGDPVVARVARAADAATADAATGDAATGGVGDGAGGAGEIRAVGIDLGSRESIDESWAGLADADREIDLLINNAGLMTGGLLEDQDLAEVYAMFQVNLVGVAHLSSLVLPGMLARRRGKIVNNASISGYAHLPGASTYAASKAGVVALTDSLRRELRGTGVSTLHLITPGVATDMMDATEAVYGRHMDTSGWESQPTDDWAEQVVAAILADRTTLQPGGKVAWAVRASRGPALLLDLASRRMFSRQARS